jgi:hypothetical protein
MPFLPFSFSILDGPPLLSWEDLVVKEDVLIR